MSSSSESSSSISSSSSSEEEMDMIIPVEEELSPAQKEKVRLLAEKLSKQNMFTKEEWREKITEYLTNSIDWDYEDKNGPDGWKNDYKTNIADAVNNIVDAANSVCYIKRENGSTDRTQYHQNQINYIKNNPTEYPDDEATKRLIADHQKKVDDDKGASGGTGALLYHPFGSRRIQFVITNHHVIMNDEEAKTAIAYFLHENDESVENAIKVRIKSILWESPRTTEKDRNASSLNLDFVALELNEDDVKKLKLNNKEIPGILFEETSRIQASANKTVIKINRRKAFPLLMFSHPAGLGKRLSFCDYPGEIKQYGELYYIDHKVSSYGGTSGSPLFIQQPDGGFTTQWSAGFLHYASGKAIAFQAIGDEIRKLINKSIMTRNR